jgi:hypothetical protein
MLFGLSGASSRHSHFFRDLAKSMRVDAPARAPDTASTETASDDATSTAAADAEQQASDEMIAQLGSRDRDVKSHEAAHMAAAGVYALGEASYTYQTGPDGKQYAIGGEVGVDMSTVPGNPRATIAKMMAIRAAALAPADPSPQDISVAAAASQIEAQARAELNQDLNGSSAAPAMRTAAGRYAKPVALSGAFVAASA